MPVPTPWVVEILNPVAYPNPYNTDMGDIRIGMTFTRETTQLTLKIYTVAFRKVVEYKVPLAGQNNDYVLTLPAAEVSNLAAGTYYYRLYGDTAQNEVAKSKCGKLLIIRYH